MGSQVSLLNKLITYKLFFEHVYISESTSWKMLAYLGMPGVPQVIVGGLKLAPDGASSLTHAVLFRFSNTVNANSYR